MIIHQITGFIRKLGWLVRLLRIPPYLLVEELLLNARLWLELLGLLL